MKIVIAQIVKNGSDLGLFVEGDLIMTADPSVGEATEDIYIIAKRLKKTLKKAMKDVRLYTVQFEPDSDWNWDEIKEELAKKEF